MRILRNCVFNHYLDEYFEARKAVENTQKKYEELYREYVLTLNMSNVSSGSYWSCWPEKYWEKQKETYATKEELVAMRKAYALQVKKAKNELKNNHRRLSKAQDNLDKAIKIKMSVNSRNAYDILETEDIEKENYYNLAALTRYPIEEAYGFNPTVVKEQHELMSKGLAPSKE